MRVVVTIGRLVVHGCGGFASEAFTESLRQQIAERISPGTSAGDIARQLRGNAALSKRDRAAAPRQGGPQGTPEKTAAAEVAGRLFK